MSTFLLVAALNMFVDSGVCCVSHSDEFLCYQMSEQTCELVGGRWSTSSNNCETFVCTSFGACCMPDLSAFSSSAAECTLAGGQYMGDGSSADEYEMGAMCPPPAGACCLGSGGCTLLTLEECDNLGGEYLGYASGEPGASFDTQCERVVCSGACCIDGMNCLDDLGPDACANLGGILVGSGTVCEEGRCLVEQQVANILHAHNEQAPSVIRFSGFDDWNGDRRLTGARLRLDGGFHRVLWLESLSDFELPSVIDISAYWRVFHPLFGELTGFDYDSRLGDPQLEGCDGVLPPFGTCAFHSPVSFTSNNWVDLDDQDLIGLVNASEMDIDFEIGGIHTYTGGGSFILGHRRWIDARVILEYEWEYVLNNLGRMVGCEPFMDAICDVAVEDGLAEARLSGIPMLFVDSSCGAREPVPVVGSCLLRGGFDGDANGLRCQQSTTEEYCLAHDGQWWPDCECQKVNQSWNGEVGACWLPDGRLVQATLGECESLGGVLRLEFGSKSLGGNVQAAPVMEPWIPELPDFRLPEFGACCLRDGTCLQLPAAECGYRGGIWNGMGISCDDAECIGGGIGIEEEDWVRVLRELPLNRLRIKASFR